MHEHQGSRRVDFAPVVPKEQDIITAFIIAFVVAAASVVIGLAAALIRCQP